MNFTARQEGFEDFGAIGGKDPVCGRRRPKEMIETFYAREIG